MTILEATKIVKIETLLRYPLEVKVALMMNGLSEEEAIEVAAHSYQNAPHWSAKQHVENYKHNASI